MTNNFSLKRSPFLKAHTNHLLISAISWRSKFNRPSMRIVMRVALDPAILEIHGSYQSRKKLMWMLNLTERHLLI